MNTALFVLALITCSGFVFVTLQFVVGMRKIAFLCDLQYPPQTTLPHVSIIVPARNEARNLQQALSSVLSQNYPCFEVILLFTDADIVMKSDTLYRAVTHMETNHLNHLTLSPETTHKDTLLSIFSTYFSLYLFMYFKPWKASDPHSKHYMGIGAFNLIRASTYHAIGGHEPLRLNPVDDLMLGKLIKQSGFKQDFLFGAGLISVEWYASLKEMINGLMKNMFAGMKFSILFVLASTIGTFTFILWPYLGLGLTTGPTRYLNLLSTVCMVLHYQYMARLSNQPLWHGLSYPVAALLLTYVQIRSMILTLKQGGIIWRGTHYCLAELKRHRK